MRESFELLKQFKNVDKFVDFYDFFSESAKKFNLTSITDEKEVCVKHFIDSLYGEKYLSENAKVVEIGSGGGFPSVPLKIARNDLNFTLIEATKKKCDYLSEVKKRLGFENFDVLNGRCEDLAHDYNLRGRFDYAVARAVAPLNVLLEYLVPYLKVGGKAVIYKGANYKEEVESAKNALKTLSCIIETTDEYELSENFGKRAVLVVKKTSATIDRYPRSQAKIRKNPL